MKSFQNRIMALAISCIMLISAIPVFAQSNNAAKDSLSDAKYYAFLGEKPVTQNMEIWMGDKNNPESISDGVRDAWILDPSLGNDARFIYMKLDTESTSGRDNSNLEVTIEYFDEGISSLTLEYPQYNDYNNGYGRRDYNKVETLYKTAEVDYLEFQNTKTWKKHTWLVSRPALNKGLSKSDLRIGIYSDTMGTSLGGKVQISSIEIRPTGEYGIVDMDFEAKRKGNIYWEGEAMEFKASFKGASESLTGQKIPLDVEYSLVDKYGKVVDSKTDKVTLNGNGKVYGRKFTMTPDKFGPYHIKVAVRNESRKIYAEFTEMTSYIRSELGKVRNDKHWISLSRQSGGDLSDEGMEIIANAGFSGVRLDLATQQMSLSSYDHLNPNEITVQPTKADYWRSAAKYDLEVLPYVGAAQGVNAKPMSNIEPDGQVPHTDEGRERYWQLDKEALERYGEMSIGMFQLNNEQDLKGAVTEDKQAKNYADYVNYAIPRIKEMYPEMKTLVGETSGLKEDWWKNFLNAGGVDQADAVGFHIYNWSRNAIDGVPASYSDYYGNITGLKRMLKERGLEDVELWLTEYGYSAYHGAPTSEYLQACYDVQMYVLMEHQLDKLVQFQANNAHANKRTEREHNFGLTRSTSTRDLKNFGAAKDKLMMLSVMNIEMADATFVSRDDIKTKVSVRYKKTGKDKDMFVAFSAEKSDTLNINLGAKQVTCIDCYGNEYQVKSTNGIYNFALSEEPLYVKGNFTKYEILDGAETASVYVDSMTKQVSYNDRAEFTFVNNTGKELEIEVEQLPGSMAKLVENTGLKGEEGKIVFEFPSTAVKGFEEMTVTVKDGKDIYFKNRISVEYNDAIGVSFVTRIDDNKEWWLDVEIANNSSIRSFTGDLTLTNPASWVGKLPAQTITVDTNTVAKTSIKLTCREANQSKVNVGVSFTTTDGDVFGQTKSVSFAYAPKAQGDIKIDGDLSEWTDGWMYLDQQEQFETVISFAGEYRGRDDLWGKAAIKWDPDYFYFAAEVHDDIFYAQDVDAASMWSLDNIQLGLVYDPTDSLAASAFEELSFSLLDGTPQIYRHKTAMTLADPSVVDGAEMAFVNKDLVTYYELRIPWTSLISNYGKGGESTKIKAGTELKAEVVINENDGPGRKGYYMLAGGVADVKDSGKFTKLYMTE